MKMNNNKKKKDGKFAYLDYAATTPVHPEVVQAMLPYFSDKFGNPSSVHRWGQEARVAVDEAREKMAELLGCEPREIIFTGTTTVSDNLAIQGLVRALKDKSNHIITSAIEHHAVLDVVKALGKEGFKTTFLPVDGHGLVDLEGLEKTIDEETILVSIMYANNEVGTIQPIKKITAIIKQKSKDLGKQIYFHTDATTAVGWLDVNVNDLGVDLMSLGAHKFGGPKGIGLLYLRAGTPLKPMTFGGHHEFNLWSGTEAVPLIVGMAKAMELTNLKAKSLKVKVKSLRDRLIRGILKIPGTKLVGHPEKCLADIASFIVEGVEGEAMLLLLSEKGIAASSGSACTSGKLRPSHVLLAMGISPEKTHGSIRFSLGLETTEEEINYVLKVFPGIVERLRNFRRGIGGRGGK